MSDRPTVGIGLIGAGFMGRCHANAFRSVAGLFDVPVTPVLRLMADVNDAAAKESARELGFERHTGDWRTLVADPEVDIVAITAPNRLHEPMALAAIDAGKAVYCEKPLSISSQSAALMRDAAKQAGTCTMVGFNFVKNPIIQFAREIIASGEIGELTAFRGVHAEDYMGDPAVPHSFRTDPEGGGGALADIGSHIISLARFLVGPIVEVQAQQATIFPERPVAEGSNEMAPVTVDDRTVFLGKFESGVAGTFEANWAATGRKLQLAFEITGTKGAIAFTHERMNELLLYTAAGGKGRQGYTKIETGTDHEPYSRFCPASGHQLGFNDLKVIEVAALLDGYAGGTDCFPGFEEAYRIQCTVEAVQRAADEATTERVTY